MPTYLSPGVFISELPSSNQIVQSVSTSNMGIVGFTPMGPTNEATLVTSYTQFINQFGGLTKQSLLGYMVSAFYTNGGQQAYIVRVTPSDAVAADCKIQSQVTDQELVVGTYPTTGGAASIAFSGGVNTLTGLAGITTAMVGATIIITGSATAANNGYFVIASRISSSSVTVANASGVTDASGTIGWTVLQGAADFTSTGSLSALDANGGASPIVGDTLALRWRSASAAVTGGAVAKNDGVTALVGDSRAAVTPAGAKGPFFCYSGKIANALVPALDQDLYRVVPVVGTCATLHWTDSIGVQSIAIPSPVSGYVATATSAVSGTSASISFSGGVNTLTGLAGITTDMVGATIVISGSSSAANNGSFVIASRLSSSSVTVANASGVTDAGADIAWSITSAVVSLDLRSAMLTMEFALAPTSAAMTIDFIPASPSYTAVGGIPTATGNSAITGTGLVNGGGLVSGSAASLSVSGGVGTLTGLSGMTAGMVGTYMTLSGAFIPGNNGSFLIASFSSATSVTVTMPGGVDGDPNSGSIVWASGCQIDCNDGSYAIAATPAAAPHISSPILVSYQIDAWDLHPISAGAWGNNLRIDVSGNANFYSAATNSFTLFNVNVLLADDTGTYKVVESYEELNMTDPVSSVYFADVLNELSGFVTVTEPSGNQPPGQINGLPVNALAIEGGDGQVSGRIVTYTLPVTPAGVGASAPSGVGARSVSIKWNNAGLPQVISDDGAGHLTGAIDPSGTNTINYKTGALVTSLASAVDPGTFLTVTYAEAPFEVVHSEVFGDPGFPLTAPLINKGYTAGFDGTFSGSTWSREQFTDPATLSADFKGVYALSKIDEIMQVVVPDFAGDVVVSSDLLAYAASRAAQPSGGDRFIILTTPQGETANGAVNWFRYQLGQYSDYAALYWPWVRIADPLSNGMPLTVPPLGAIAGIYARTDQTKNVGKSPGGTVDGAIQGTIGLEYNPTQGDRDTVYPNKINPLINSTQTGRAVWGVRTISIDSQWRYINARRLFMFLEKSIYNSTFWVVFENNGPGLWGQIKTQLNGFLGSLFGGGYFAGASPAQAYFVICDSSNNTPATIDAGQVIINVGAAPNVPAEFVVTQFQQITLSA